MGVSYAEDKVPQSRTILPPKKEKKKQFFTIYFTKTISQTLINLKHCKQSLTLKLNEY